MALGNDQNLNIVVRLKDEASKQLKSFQAQVEKMEPSFKKMAAVGTASFAAISGVLAVSVNKYLEVGGAIDDMSKKTGFGTEAISKLKYAAEQSGTSIEALEVGVKTMAKFMESGRDGADSYATTLAKIGVSASELKGLSPEENFMALANGIASVKDPMQQAAVAMDIFGKAGTDMLPLFAEGPEAIKKFGEQAEKLGVVFSAEKAAMVADLGDKIDALKTGMMGIGFAIAEAVLPYLTRFVDFIKPVIESIVGWVKENPTLVATIIAVGLAVSALVAGIGFLGLIITPIIAGFAFITSGAGVLLIAILALVGGIIYLVKNWDKVKESLITVWGFIVEAFKRGVNLMIGLAEGWANSWVKAANVIIGALNKIKFSIPSWVPGIGGKSFGINIPTVPEVALPRFEHGGTVPGARGTETPIIAHGGEQVIPAGRSGLGGDVQINLTINNPRFNSQEDVGAMRVQIERALRDVVRVYKLQPA